MFTKDTLLIDAFYTEGANLDAMARTLQGFQLGCLGCMLSHGETIGQAAMVHGIDPDVLLNALNEAAATPIE